MHWFVRIFSILVILSVELACSKELVAQDSAIQQPLADRHDSNANAPSQISIPNTNGDSNTQDELNNLDCSSTSNSTCAVRVGPLTGAPLTCNVGDAYWAMDEGEWWSGHEGPDGRLYRCTSANVWSLHYTPYTYMHPLRGVTDAAPASYSIPANGGVSFVTTDTSTSQLTVSHARIEQSGQTGESIAGVAIVGLRKEGVLVTEAGVPATTPIPSGRLFAEIRGAVNTGIAISNPNALDAVVSYYLTDAFGVDFGGGSFTVKANNQMAGFLDQAPFYAPANWQGTLTFSSSVPVSAIGLRGLLNERSEFLISTLPVTSLSFPQPSDLLPHFMDGGGWTTQVVLVNPLDRAISGTVQFFGQGSVTQDGLLLDMIVNGSWGSTFYYSIAPRAAATLVTSGTNTDVQVGSVRITPANDFFIFSGDLPVAVATLSFRNSGVTVSETSVLAQPGGSGFRMYMESSGIPGQPGAIQSGLTLANSSQLVVTALLELRSLDGTPLGLPAATINLPANGQVTAFINELYPGLGNFRGIARFTAPSSVALAVLRKRFNERGDSLITTIPALSDAAIASGDLIFPHVISGLGYNTQIILFGRVGPGKLYLFSQDGTLRSGLVLK